VIGERCGIARVRSGQVQIEIQLAHAVDAVGAGNIDAVAVCRTRSCPGKVIAFVRREDKQGVALIDSGRFQVGKKSPECGVVIGELFYVGSFTGAKSTCRTECCTLVIVVSVGDVSEDHRNALLQHGFDHRQSLRWLRIEIQLAETRDRVSVVVGKAAQRRRNVLHPEQRLIAAVAAWFIRQQVRHSIVLR